MTCGYGVFFVIGNKLSTRTDTLDKKTVAAWREFTASPAFERGIAYLRHNEAPKCEGSEAELVKSAIGWAAYMKALKDVEDVLTYIPEQIKSAEEPGLIQ